MASNFELPTGKRVREDIEESNNSDDAKERMNYNEEGASVNEERKDEDEDQDEDDNSTYDIETEPSNDPYAIQAQDEVTMANHALEMLSSTNGTRSSFIQCLVVGDLMRFQYTDSTGIVWSTHFSWIRELEKFAAILVALAHCDQETFGITVPGLTPLSPMMVSIPPTSLRGYYLDMLYQGASVRVTLGEPIYVQHSLVGRATRVYEATTNAIIPGSPKLVIKISMQLLNHKPEIELLLKAIEANVGDHLPKPYIWSTGRQPWCSSDGVWGLMYPENDVTKSYKPRRQDILVLTRYTPLKDILKPENMDSLFGQLFARKSHLLVIQPIRLRSTSVQYSMTFDTRLTCSIVTLVLTI